MEEGKAFQAQLKQCQARVTDIQINITQSTDLLNQCQQKSQEIINEHQQLKQQKTSLELLVKQAENQQSQLTIQLNQQIKAVQDKLGGCETRNINLKVQLDTAKEQIKSLNSSVKESTKQQEEMNQLQINLSIAIRQNSDYKQQVVKSVSQANLNIQQCQKEKEGMILEMLSLRQQIRSLTINIEANFTGRIMRSHHKRKRAGMLLNRCRSDLDLLAELWIKTSQQADFILNRRFEYLYEDNDEAEEANLYWQQYGLDNSRSISWTADASWQQQQQLI